MELPPRPVGRGAPTLATLLAAERAWIQAGSSACAQTCDCHGGNTCERTDDPGQPNAEPPVPAGHPYNGSPHLAHQADASLIQWHVDNCPTLDEQAAAAAAAQATRTAATHALLTKIDSGLLVQLLEDGGYLPSPTSGEGTVDDQLPGDVIVVRTPARS